MERRLVILGSSRSDGNTAKVIEELKRSVSFNVLDLLTKDIGAFDYDFKNQDDDFLSTIRHIVEHYDTLIFATPIYWYAMSGTMKIFFDRISDCLKIDKNTGRKLRGMKMAALCCGSDSTEIEGFFVPFRLSAEYLGMTYLGDVHTWIDGEELDVENVKRIKEFSSVILD